MIQWIQVSMYQHQLIVKFIHNQRLFYQLTNIQETHSTVKEFIVEPRGHGSDARSQGAIVKLKMWNSKTKLSFPVIWNYLFLLNHWKVELFFFCLFMFLFCYLILCKFFWMSLFSVSSSGCMTNTLTPLF